MVQRGTLRVQWGYSQGTVGVQSGHSRGTAVLVMCGGGGGGVCVCVVCGGDSGGCGSDCGGGSNQLLYESIFALSVKFRHIQ